jgi:hypothetical protein
MRSMDGAAEFSACAGIKTRRPPRERRPSRALAPGCSESGGGAMGSSIQARCRARSARCIGGADRPRRADEARELAGRPPFKSLFLFLGFLAARGGCAFPEVP